MTKMTRPDCGTDAGKYIGAPPPAFETDIATAWARDLFGVAGNLRPLWGERDQNFAVLTEAGPGFVLKISNAREVPEELDLQIKALTWLETTAPSLSLPRLRPTLGGAVTARVPGAGDDWHSLHMVSLLDGVQLGEVEPSAALFEAAGAQAGAVAAALRGFFHPKAGHALFWDIRHLDGFLGHADGIGDRSLAGAVRDLVPAFVSDILPALGRLRAQVIHHDTNPTNVLVSETMPRRVTGLVDFGDALHGSLAQDVAVAALELATGARDILEAAAQVVAGYDRAMPLDEDEIDLLYDLMVARAALGLLIGASRNRHDIKSATELDYGAMYAPALETLLSAGRGQVRDILRAACRFPRHTPKVPVARGTHAALTEDLIRRRHAVLGADLPLTYKNPLHTEKGLGTWLYDIDGHPVLDCYNNVCHVGHSHPHVVRAVARQAATLNTNARYIYSNIIEYAERLGRLMPGDLGACLFVNSGSEAVDLALRMARAVSGQSGMLAMQDAYHGITVESAAVSPATDWGVSEPANAPHESVTRTDIELVMNPDLVRGPFGTDRPDVAELYAADVDRAIAALNCAGHPPGVFIADTAFSSSGILDLPDGYLSSVTDRVHAAGGLVIADEVQYGFGRSGSHFWGFDRYGIIPDFVSLGKPIGNGIALGCVVTTPDILSRFMAQHGFFSTFGGNPVACAAAGAVLDVIEREELQQNAHETGTYLIDGLRNLAESTPMIGQVRGRGLFVGVDIVSDKAAMAADPARCSAIKNGLRDLGLLVGSDGYHDNILKIRPPMVFSRSDAQRLIDAMRTVTRQIA